MPTNYLALGILIALRYCLTDVTCLPNAYGCRIEVNTNTAIAKPRYNNQQPGNVYSCTPGNSSTQYEVHVLAMYKGNRHTRPPSAGDATVNIVSGGQSGRSIVLVLGSYEPVNWILNLPADITISKVILVAYYIAQSSVNGDVNKVQAFERKPWQWGMGYGNDIGGGNTVALLRQVHNRFGVVTSFSGTYKADQWSLTLSSTKGHGHTSAMFTTPTTAPLPPIPTTTPKPRPRPGGYKIVCKGGFCVCIGQGYGHNTCLPVAYGCKIFANTDKALAIPRYNKQPAQPVYSCKHEHSSTQYEVHVLSVYEVINRRPPSAGVKPLSVSSAVDANAYGCRIEVNTNTAIAKPRYNNQQPRKVYSCTPGNSSTQYEVHVLAMYKGNRHTRPPSAGDATVNIVSGGQSGRSIVLVLGSYEPVNWILNLPADVTISKVILVAYYIAQSSVNGDVNKVQAFERKPWQWGMGYGNDIGGGNTVALLRQVHNRFGVVTSFTGTYKADQWSLTLSSTKGHRHTSAIVTTPTAAPLPPIPPTTPKPTVHRQKCYWGSKYCPGGYKMNAVCKGGFCVCTGQGYGYNTCLPDAYGCKIFANTDKALAIPRYNKQPAQPVYSCKHENSSTQYEVHVLSVYEVINKRPPSAGNATVNIVGRGRSGRRIILVLGSYEPVNWILSLPAGVIISRVILVAYYVDQSSVSGDLKRVKAVEKHNWQWGMGYGSDSGGGDTVALLKQVHDRFGGVTSFTGTYRADEWSLKLPSPQGQSGTPCQTIVCLSEAIKKLREEVKQMGEELETQQERISVLERDKN